LPLIVQLHLQATWLGSNRVHTLLMTLRLMVRQPLDVTIVTAATLSASEHDHSVCLIEVDANWSKHYWVFWVTLTDKVALDTSHQPHLQSYRVNYRER
jgi:hypothetical protein